MKNKLLSLMICCIILTGCGAEPTQQNTEDIIKDSQVHTVQEETFITKFDGINAYNLKTGEFKGKASDYVESHGEDKFLGYDCSYSELNVYLEQIIECDDFDNSIDAYSIYITSKDDIDKCASDIDSYLMSLSESQKDLSSYNASLGKAYICKDYVVVLYRAETYFEEQKEKYGDELINLVVMDYNYYSNKFKSQIK